MKQKKIPMRMCLGCQVMKPKKDLIRVVKNKEDEISVDFSGKKAGRGAYICGDVSCFEKARKAKRFERAFEAPINEAVYEALRLKLEAGDDR